MLERSIVIVLEERENKKKEYKWSRKYQYIRRMNIIGIGNKRN
jgi:hypothetical protein